MPKKVIYVAESTYRMIKLCSVGKTHDEVLRRAVDKLAEGGVGVTVDYDRSDELKYRVEVSSETHYLLSRLKVELDCRSYDELIFDMMVNYLASLGMSDVCIREILELEV